MSKKIILTGGCGFIGHHIVQYIYKKTDWEIVIFDKLNYASFGLRRLRDSGLLNDNRIRIFTIDLTKEIPIGIKQEIGNNVSIILHLAAETHVDNSITNPRLFVKNNVMSTVSLLDYARNLVNLECFFYFSTDEVFGAAPKGIGYSELDRHNPSNPYSASKSAAENICISYFHTYGLPVIVGHFMNAFGERQHHEKFIPNTIKKVLNGETVIIHTDKDMIPGSRFYIHIHTIAKALFFLLKNGSIGDRYNIVGEKEMNNLELAKFIANVIGKELKYQLTDFHSQRPGHDICYSLDDAKMKKLGWKLPGNFEESLKKTIKWTLENRVWLK